MHPLLSSYHIPASFGAQSAQFRPKWHLARQIDLLTDENIIVDIADC